LATTGSTAAAYAEAEEPVSTLINDFGPPVASASAGRQRAAMPFVHLEREIWDLRDGSGTEIRAGCPGARPVAGSLARWSRTWCVTGSGAMVAALSRRAGEAAG
jgi:hypothetical protein